jgi:hypothetical protein
VVALIKQKDLDQLKSVAKTPVMVLGEDRRKLLVSNR